MRQNVFVTAGTVRTMEDLHVLNELTGWRMWCALRREVFTSSLGEVGRSIDVRYGDPGPPSSACAGLPRDADTTQLGALALPGTCSTPVGSSTSRFQEAALDASDSHSSSSVPRLLYPSLRHPKLS